MGRKSFALLAVASMVIAACGDPRPTSVGPDDPVVQIRSEGSFAPVEFILGQGPRYTLLGDGRVISEGPTVAIYPGPLVPNTLITTISDADMDEILDLVDDIGLAGMDYELDDSAASFVADAGTEVVTYWDKNGLHQYAVYALGIEPNPTDDKQAAFLDLLAAFGNAVAGADALPYVPERVRVLAAVATTPPEPGFQDVRPWPLGEDDPADWTEVNLGWTCNVYGADVLSNFEDATQLTQWLHPVETMDAPPFALLVRPLHPGEEDCEIPSPQAN